MRINNNVAAFNANRNLSSSNMSLGKSLEKLSSGFRINRAGDDAAGLTISQGLRAQASGLQQATRNAQDGISVVQTAEGALTEVHSMLNRMRDLSVQASNTGSQDANAIAASQKEFAALRDEITRIADTTSFGSKKLLDGTFGNEFSSTGTAVAFPGAGATAGQTVILTPTAVGATAITATFAGGEDAEEVVDVLNAAFETAGSSFKASVSYGQDGATFKISGAENYAVTGTGVATIGTMGTVAQTGTGGAFQVGANAGADQQIAVSIGATSAAGLGLNGLDLTGDASAAITALDDAISTVSSTRSDLGALQNRFESTINNLQVSTENIVASESRIRDTDMATEMTNFTKQQILQQAGTAMLGQANSLPQGVLRLLG